MNFPYRVYQLVELVSLNSLDNFYITDSPLSVTNTVEMAMFYTKLTILSDFLLEEGPVSPTGQFK